MVYHCHALTVVQILGSQCHAALRLALLPTRQSPQECFANLLACASAVVVDQEDRRGHRAMRLPAKAHLILVHIGVEQLLVAAVDNSRTITGSKDMGHSVALEGLEGDRFAA